MSVEDIKNQEPTAEEIAAAEQAQDVQAKTLLVEKTILDLCRPDSEFEDLREIDSAIKEGDSLVFKQLSGGITNYSYKVSLASGKKDIFAKVCFEYALWNPNRSIKYDLSRVENEFEIMKKASTFEPSPVVEPYACVDVVDDDKNKMKVLITEWATTDEQMANQFIDGEADGRVVEKVAKLLGNINTSTDFDVHFNEECRSCLISCFPVFVAVFEAIAGTDAKDKYLDYGRKMGLDKFKALVEAMEKNYMSQEVLCHGDPNVGNILVEPKPSIETLESFGPTGDMKICDWEMSYAGPLGRDVGWFQSFPVAAALYHASHGHREEIAQSIFAHLETFWNEYEAILRSKGKGDEYIRQTYLNSFVWNGFFLGFAYYLFGGHVQAFPLNSLTADEQAMFKGSYGYVGLRLVEAVFAEDSPVKNFSLPELQKFYKDIVMKEIKDLSESKERRARPRQPSMLRASGRRLSDAGVLEAAAFRASMQLRASGVMADFSQLVVDEHKGE